MPRILGKIGEVTESSLHKVGNLGLSLYFSEETCEDLEFIWEVCKMCKNKGRSCFEENCKILATTFAKTPFWKILYFFNQLFQLVMIGSSGGGKAQSLLQKVGGPRSSETTSTHPGHHL